MTAKDLAARLAQDPEAVCRLLLPAGKKTGSEWRAGSVFGDAGESLGVHLTGVKAGVWKDFSADERGGDLIDLWAASRSIPLAEALREVKAHLGVSDPKFERHPVKPYRVPAKPAVTAPKGRVAAYLLDARKLSVDAVKAYRVAAGKDDDEIVFPFLRGGRLVNVKYLKLERNLAGKKLMRLEPDCEPCLFGWQAIPAGARKIGICEGELDALSLWQYGFPALSVFSGAGNHQWLESEYPNLEIFDEIFLVFDNDAPGQKGCRELAERLGNDRCRIVKLPAKDANECLQRDISKEDIAACFANAQTCDPEELRNCDEYTADVIREFYPRDEDRIGFDSPWGNLSGKLKFRPSEVIVLSGFNGCGKSQLIGQIVLSAIEQGEKACVASLEMLPKKWLRRIDVQAGATQSPSIPFIKKIQGELGKSLWVFDRVGAAKTKRLLDVFSYARKRYGVTLFVVDSLLKCGIGEEDYNGQKLFVEALCDLANQSECTAFLLTHSRKAKNENEQSDKMDVRGAGAITDLASTVLTLWRNKPKEENPLAHAEKPDAILACQKQRYGDWEGRKYLWFDAGSYQYLEHSNDKPCAFVSHLQSVPKAADEGCYVEF